MQSALPGGMLQVAQFTPYPCSMSPKNRPPPDPGWTGTAAKTLADNAQHAHGSLPPSPTGARPMATPDDHQAPSLAHWSWTTQDPPSPTRSQTTSCLPRTLPTWTWSTWLVFRALCARHPFNSTPMTSSATRFLLPRLALWSTWEVPYLP